MMLKDKVAVIFGAGGDVGAAVARAFAREGAKLFLSGRTLGPVKALATEISAGGGLAEAAEVDALDEQAVEKYVASVVEKAGAIESRRGMLYGGRIAAGEEPAYPSTKLH